MISTPLFRMSDVHSPDEENEIQFDIRDEISAKDIAVALVLLKKQHRLSTKCVDDIISLLKVFGVCNTPSSWYEVKRLLSESKPTSTNHFICPVCSNTTANEQKCTKCSSTHAHRLSSFWSFSITEQIEKILTNNHDIDPLYTSRTTALRDIRDGAMFRSLRAKSTNRIITLTLNIDGIQPSRNSQSTIWPIILVINDLPPDRRFALENIILAGVWSGKTKPSRDSVKLFLQPMIDELIDLEKGYLFASSDNSYYMKYVYLIAACCDKPAQALVQCIPEPIAAFGCGQCEVSGKQLLSSMQSFAFML